MAEVTKPDYLSLVNQSGSGFNVSELVDLLLLLKLSPNASFKIRNWSVRKAQYLVLALNSQAYTTEKNFNVLSEDKYFEITSSNSTGIEIEPLDETKLSEGIREISNVSMAENGV